MSQRQLAAAVGLSPSNMKYIEDGINRYEKIYKVQNEEVSIVTNVEPEEE